MKALLLRAFVLARRRHHLAASTRRQYRQRLERDLDGVMTLAPTQRDGQRLRKRYGKLRSHLFTFLHHPEVRRREQRQRARTRPTATYRKVTGGFRSDWGSGPVRSLPLRRRHRGTAGIDAYQAVRMTLSGHSVLAPGLAVTAGLVGGAVFQVAGQLLRNSTLF